VAPEVDRERDDRDGQNVGGEMDEKAGEQSR
jgi:hypothetical protein